MKKTIFIIILSIVVIIGYFIITSNTDTTQTSKTEEYKFKPAKFRTDTTFMCGANISRKTAKLYFDSNTLKVTFDNRQYISNRNGGVSADINYYVTSDHYTNPNQLYMEVEEAGSSIRITGDSVTPKGIVYSCFEVD